MIMMRGGPEGFLSRTDAHAGMGIKGIASCACPGLDPIAVSSKRRVGGWTIIISLICSI